MTQPAPNPHTQRSVAGMVGSMIVVVVVVVGWVGFRSLVSDPPSPPPRVVDWTVAVNIGKQANALALYAPAELPPGWTAKDARYSGGDFPRWELALRTAAVKVEDARTVSIAEAIEPAGRLVNGIDEDAVEGDAVTINGVRWRTWRFSGGDYGISLIAQTPTGAAETVLVYGSGTQVQIRDFAASLRPTNAGSAPTGSSTASAN